MTPKERELAEKTVCVMLMRGGVPGGSQVYAYVAVRGDRLQDFVEARHRPGFMLEDYGTILESGFGEPTDEVAQKMEEQYGFVHDAMIDLTNEGAPDTP